MLTLVVIFILSLALFAFVALPLLGSRKLDPLADERDPVVLDLEEERDALYRAIYEIEGRQDLPEARRASLRARYEAKAAQVLRRLDEYGQRAPTPARPAPRRGFGVPVTALALLSVGAVSLVLLSNFVMPRVGGDASVTTADPLRIERARDIQRLQRLVQEDPSTENLVALAEAHWLAENFAEAREVYGRLENEANGGAPNVAFRRLGFFALQEGDVERGLDYLERARGADPQEPETLFALGDVYSFLGRNADALAAWEAYAELPVAIHDEALENRLERARTLASLQARVEEEPGEENLMAFADAHWALDERDTAASIYLRVIQEANPRNEQAVRRLGMALFFAGRSGDAIQLLEIARHIDPRNLEGLLFLGNAYFSEERYAEAIDVWEDYVEVAGGPERAGRVPSLIENARQALGGEPVEAPGDDAPAIAGEAAELFAQNCSSCHGLAGEGVVGPRLAGNPNAGDALNVRRVIARGRGMMPAFSHLSEDELDGLARYVVERIYPEGTTGGR